MEYWDIYDQQGHFLGYSVPKGQTLQKTEYHIAVEAWLLNEAGEVLIQQRSLQCQLLPGVWGLTTGRLVAGEDSLTGCLREVQEELGVALTRQAASFLRRIIRADGTQLIWDLYLLRCSLPESAFLLQQEEVSQVRWVPLAQIEPMARQGKLFQYPELASVVDQIKSLLALP